MFWNIRKFNFQHEVIQQLNIFESVFSTLIHRLRVRMMYFCAKGEKLKNLHKLIIYERKNIRKVSLTQQR